MTQTRWLDYESSECSWFFTAANEEDDAELPSVSVENSGACDYWGLYERLEVATSVSGETGVDLDIYVPSIPLEVAMLTSLKSIEMSNNQVPTTLMDFLPESLSQLTDLQEVHFSRSNILEWSPQAFLRFPSSIEILDLSYNDMEGELLDEIGFLMSSLEELYLDHNRLDGSIPVALFNWTRLKRFYASVNNLDGNLVGPVELEGRQFCLLFGLQYSLTLLFLFFFLLQPSEIAALSSHLEILSLSDNTLGGSLPSELGALDELTTLDLDSNRFQGALPSELGMLSNLAHLGVANNRLESSIPSEFGGLANLQNLHLDANDLTGEIPSELTLLSSLTNFQLSANNLVGTISPAFASLSNLFSFDVHDNALTGSVPKELFEELSVVSFLYLYENQLTGSIATEIGMLGNVSYVGMESNMLTGPIPSEVSAMRELRYLHLSNNRLTSTIPSTLGNLPSLKYLFLGTNNLSGSIPSELGLLSGLRYLDLGGGNDLMTGSVPSELCALPSLSIRVKCTVVQCDCGCQCS